MYLPAIPSLALFLDPFCTDLYRPACFSELLRSWQELARPSPPKSQTLSPILILSKQGAVCLAGLDVLPVLAALGEDQLELRVYNRLPARGAWRNTGVLESRWMKDASLCLASENIVPFEHGVRASCAWDSGSSSQTCEPMPTQEVAIRSGVQEQARPLTTAFILELGKRKTMNLANPSCLFKPLKKGLVRMDECAGVILEPRDVEDPNTRHSWHPKSSYALEAQPSLGVCPFHRPCSESLAHSDGEQGSLGKADCVRKRHL